jgi:hypothetical protein
MCAAIGFVVTRIPRFRPLVFEARTKWERFGEYAGAGVLAIFLAALGVMAIGLAAVLVEAVLGIIQSLRK